VPPPARGEQRASADVCLPRRAIAAADADADAFPRTLNPQNPKPKHSYSGFGAAFLMTLMVVFGPDRTLQAWAKPVAERELAEEDAAFARYSSDSAYREAMDARLAAHGRHPDRFYDAVMMRREYAVLKAQHDGGGK
jgi:hypothetical protein